MYGRHCREQSRGQAVPTPSGLYPLLGEISLSCCICRAGVRQTPSGVCSASRSQLAALFVPSGSRACIKAEDPLLAPAHSFICGPISVTLNVLHGRGEVSEWLKEHAWKACVGETQPWVRIPPSPPVFPFCFDLVNGRPFSVYLWCTLRFEERHGILAPSTPYIGLFPFSRSTAQLTPSPILIPLKRRNSTKARSLWASYARPGCVPSSVQ